jgi:Ser/Thr protein kinase RdoA (MazF antagonist)
MSELHGLIALQGPPAEVTTSEAEEVARRLYGIEGAAEPLAGERDRNFRLMTDQGPCVLKFLDVTASETIVAGQTAVLRHLATNCELPLPRLLPTLAGQDLGVARTASERWRVRLVTYLPGELLLHVHPERTLLRDIGRQIGVLDRALEDFTHPALAQQIVWDIRQLPRLTTLLPRLADPQARRLLTAALPPALAILPRLATFRSQAIHGDCHPGNLLVSTATARCTGIIDLGDLIHAPVILEIAVTVAESLAVGVASDDDVVELLRGFGQSQAVRRPECHALYELLLARLCVMELMRGWRADGEVPEDATDAGSPAAAMQAMDKVLSQGRSGWVHRFVDAIETAPATDEVNDA